MVLVKWYSNNYKIRFQGGMLLGNSGFKSKSIFCIIFSLTKCFTVKVYKAKEDFQGIFQGMDSRYIRTTLSAYFMYSTTTLVYVLGVLCDRVLKTKINLKNFFALVFISCFKFSRSWSFSSIIQKGGKFKINFRL